MMSWELGRWQHFFLNILSLFAAISVIFWGSSFQIILMLILHFLNFLISGTVTYHRLLSHRSWHSPRWFEVFGTLLGIFSFTGSSITRTIVHRQHHHYSDTQKDPHSPWHSSLIELYFPMLFYKGQLERKFGMDLLRDKFHVNVHRYYLLFVLGTTGLVGVLSYFLTSSLLEVWLWMATIVLAPATFSWMTIYLGNLLCHLNTNEKEGDRSKNNWFIVIIGMGEGWHYNHHMQPENPNFGRDRWDPGWWLIKLIQNKSS